MRLSFDTLGLNMTTVALIGGDGSGKSTLADSLRRDLPMPVKYIYMGANLESSNYSLPWSKLALKLKLRKLARSAKERGITDPGYVSTHHMSHRQQPTSLIRTVLRLSNRLLEVAYRNLVAIRWQRQGHLVLFDRHFLFDTFLKDGPFWSAGNIEKVDRIYYWILLHVFPQPDLILFLDADPEVMVARKQEATVEYLRERNAYWRTQGRDFESFVIIDANHEAPQVAKDAEMVIMTYIDSGLIGAADGSVRESEL